MLKTINSKLALLVIVGSLSLFGCGDSKDEKKGSADLSAAGDLLQYVPADSPYVFASLAPLPDDVMDKLEPNIDRVLASYETVLQETFVMASERARVEGSDDDDLEKASAVFSELSSLMSIEGLRGAGFERDSLAVLYGNGLLPVLRFEVSDGALFEAALERIEDSADAELDTATLSGNSVRYIDADELKILIAVLDTQVVITVAPLGFDDEQLNALLGFVEPAKAITDSGKLQAIANEYAFNEYMIGYFDLEAVATTVTGGATGLDADLYALFGKEAEITDVCRDEIRSMAGIAPRVVMGYTDITTERFVSKAVVELREDIAEGLASVSAAVPGLGGDMGGLLSFGMSFDVESMRDFVEARLDAMEEDPLECPDFADIQAGVAQARMGLAQPMPPMVYDFRGFTAILDNVEGLNFATQAPPTAIDGRFLIAMDNAPSFVAMGAMFSPELASLNLQPDSEPVLLDVPQAQMVGSAIYAALSDDALAMSIGDGAESQLGTMLSADADDNGVFFNFSMDAERYYSFIGEAIAASKHDDDNEMSPEFQDAMQEVMLAIADMYDRMTLDMRFTSDGMVMDSTITLGE